MTDAMTALALQWGSYALLIGAVVAFGWWLQRYLDRRDRIERQETVRRVEGYRERLAWEAACARAEWRLKQKAKRQARSRLAQFHNGGTPAA